MELEFHISSNLKDRQAELYPRFQKHWNKTLETLWQEDGDREGIRRRLFDEYVHAYGREEATFANAMNGDRLNCSNNSKVMSAGFIDGKVKLGPGEELGLLKYTDHVAPVILKREGKGFSVVDLVSAQPIAEADLPGPIYHPAFLINGLLRSAGGKAVDDKSLVLVRPDPKVIEQKQKEQIREYLARQGAKPDEIEAAMKMDEVSPDPDQPALEVKVDFFTRIKQGLGAIAAGNLKTWFERLFKGDTRVHGGKTNDLAVYSSDEPALSYANGRPVPRYAENSYKPLPPGAAGSPQQKAEEKVFGRAGGKGFDADSFSAGVRMIKREFNPGLEKLGYEQSGQSEFFRFAESADKKVRLESNHTRGASLALPRHDARQVSNMRFPIEVAWDSFGKPWVEINYRDQAVYREYERIPSSRGRAEYIDRATIGTFAQEIDSAFSEMELEQNLKYWASGAPAADEGNGTNDLRTRLAQMDNRAGDPYSAILALARVDSVSLRVETEKKHDWKMMQGKEFLQLPELVRARGQVYARVRALKKAVATSDPERRAEQWSQMDYAQLKETFRSSKELFNLPDTGSGDPAKVEVQPPHSATHSWAKWTAATLEAAASQMKRLDPQGKARVVAIPQRYAPAVPRFGKILAPVPVNTAAVKEQNSSYGRRDGRLEFDDPQVEKSRLELRNGFALLELAMHHYLSLQDADEQAAADAMRGAIASLAQPSLLQAIAEEWDQIIPALSDRQALQEDSQQLLNMNSRLSPILYKGAHVSGDLKPWRYLSPEGDPLTAPLLRLRVAAVELGLRKLGAREKEHLQMPLSILVVGQLGGSGNLNMQVTEEEIAQYINTTNGDGRPDSLKITRDFLHMTVAEYLRRAKAQLAANQ